MYFDNAASSKISPAVINNIENIVNNYSNPSSFHDKGRELRAVIDETRDIIADLLKIKSENVFFTSSATIANYISINSAVKLNKTDRRHIITSDFEHDSIKKNLIFLENKGYKITRIKPVKGLIRSEDIINSINDDTFLIAIMRVNNETGSINDIYGLKDILREKDIKFISDCVQAFYKVETDINKLGIDYYIFSPHKIGSLKGIGVLISKKENLTPLYLGGNQERGIFSGTENTTGIIALNYVLKDLKHRDLTIVKKIKTIFRDFILKFGGNIIEANHTSDYILSASFNDIPPQVLSNIASDNGLYISFGSACHSKSKDISNSFIYCSKDLLTAKNAFRISFSPYNTIEEANRAVKVLENGVNYIRGIL